VAHSKASLKNVTEEFFGVGYYRCYAVVEKKRVTILLLMTEPCGKQAEKNSSVLRFAK
jgi:hypothetical protein